MNQRLSAFTRDLALREPQGPHDSYFEMLSTSCVPAAVFSGAGSRSPYTWCLSTSQDASDVRLLNLYKSLSSPPINTPPPFSCVML